MGSDLTLFERFLCIGSRVSLGVAVLSGMIAATVLGTLLVPIFYKWVQTVRDRKEA